MGIQELSNIAQLKLQHELPQESKTERGGNTEFSRLLKKGLEEEGVQFSKHAAMRISQRGMQVTDNLMENLNMAVEKAGLKGAKDVVVISAQSAFIVNVPNKTVVTAISGNEMKDNIFTNIDSAVLI